MGFQVYNTGDRVWVSKRYGKDTTVKFITHDGWVWEEGESTNHRLAGTEKYVHAVEVFFIKLLLGAFNA